jgi:hypothetical protein
MSVRAWLDALAGEPAVQSVLGIARRVPELELPKVECANREAGPPTGVRSCTDAFPRRKCIDSSTDVDEPLRSLCRNVAMQDLTPGWRAGLRDLQGFDLAVHGQLLEGVRLDLPHALTREAELAADRL